VPRKDAAVPPPLRPVALVPVGAVDADVREALAQGLAALGYVVRAGTPLPLEGAWRDAGTGRLESERLLLALLARPRRHGDAVWSLAMVDAVLCGGEVGEVLGEAALGRGCAVVGIEPLRRGSGADPDVLRDRILTTAVHELGHLAGAAHCRRATCVMYPSRNIADTDRKGMAFCHDCAAEVQGAFGRES
jgi:archaemetzincin